MWVIPEDLGNFSSRRKIIFWGAKIQTSFGVEFRNALFSSCDSSKCFRKNWFNYHATSAKFKTKEPSNDKELKIEEEE
jgi:hypothetical protein